MELLKVTQSRNDFSIEDPNHFADTFVPDMSPEVEQIQFHWK